MSFHHSKDDYKKLIFLFRRTHLALQWVDADNCFLYIWQYNHLFVVSLILFFWAWYCTVGWFVNQINPPKLERVYFYNIYSLWYLEVTQNHLEFYTYPCYCFEIIYVIPSIWIVTFNICGFVHVVDKEEGILYMDGLDNISNFLVICYQLNQLLNLFWPCWKADD